MKGHWWSYVVGFLCLQAEVINTWTVFQSPTSIFHMKVNSSAEITCSTSSPGVLGLYLHRKFHDKTDVVYLSLDKGKVTKNTTATEYAGRLHVTANKQVKEGVEFTIRLSLLELDDTDLYYCKWSQFSSAFKYESMSSNGTVVIVREHDPHEQCEDQILNYILVTLSGAAFTVILFVFIGALILRCRQQFKKQFRPARAVQPPRPRRPHYSSPQQSVQHYPYWITSEQNFDFRGFQ